MCHWDAHRCAAPTCSQNRIAHRPNHDTNTCTSGTTCAANPSSNRNLLDYFAIDVDKAGHPGFVWSDTDNATLEPFVKVARQASGPSLFAGQPNAPPPHRAHRLVGAMGAPTAPNPGPPPPPAPHPAAAHPTHPTTPTPLTKRLALPPRHPRPRHQRRKKPTRPN